MKKYILPIALEKKTALFFVVVFGFNVYASVAQQNTNLSGSYVNAISTAVPFLLIAPDARAGAMGDAGVASAPDANSTHWNPSKLAFAEKNTGFSLSYTPWLHNLAPDINLCYFSGYRKIKKNQTIGISAVYFSLGKIDFSDINGHPIGSFSPNEFAVDATYSRKLSNKFSGGITLRYINSNLSGGTFVEGNKTYPGRSIAGDFSGYYQDDEIEVFEKKSRLSFGFNISNVGTKISYTHTGNKDFIPINLRLGSGFKIEFNEHHAISCLLDFNKLLVPSPPVFGKNKQIIAGKNPNVSVPEGMLQSFSDAPGGFSEELREINYSVGFEYLLYNIFAGRCGFFYEDPTKGNRKFFTAGIGVKYNIVGLDLAYLIATDQKNPLANTIRFSLWVSFNAFKRQKKLETN